MLHRCTQPHNGRYASYGGRGITVCERWHSFENFIADMGSRPDGTTLDRFPNNDGSYEPGNCRWATPKEQSSNRRSNRFLTFGGETLTLTEWARRLGVGHRTLGQRLDKWGWSVERTLSTPGKRYAGCL